MFKKGDIVKYNTIVRSMPVYRSDGTHKEITKYSVKPERIGIVLGYSFIKSGKIIKSYYYDETNHLRVKKIYKVLVIEPFEQNNTWLNDKPIFKTNRYLEPVRCFESDIELIKED